jgi:putative transposase
LYNWKKDKSTDEDNTQRELKELRQQNTRLKKMFANLSMDHEILQEGYEMVKKYAAQDAKKK